jgi:hypothetical protein
MSNAHWELVPTLSIGPLALGMDTAEVRELLGAQVPMSMLPEQLAGKLEFYIVGGHSKELAPFMVKVDYSVSGRVDAIEVRGGRLILNGISLFDTPLSQLKKQMYALSDDLVVDEHGINSKALGIGLYAPHGNPEKPADAVILFSRGYYDVLEGEEPSPARTVDLEKFSFADRG